MNYDAIIIISFGGPEKMDDVVPFIEQVLKGKDVPAERKKEVIHHYKLFDGISPINSQCRALISALEKNLTDHNINLPIYWGNRNWHPFLEDTVRKMASHNIRKALAFITSANSSYSSCRQYLEDIQQARSAVGMLAPQIDKIRAFYNHPGFIESNTDHINNAIAKLSTDNTDSVWIVFTAHSIPNSMADKCDYKQQLNESCRLVAEQLDHQHWSLAFQSRSGSLHTPWLGPDICDHLHEVKEKNFKNIIIAPIGFVSDHMEVLFDLDIEAAEFCNEHGIRMQRAKTASVHPSFITMIRELICERLFDNQERRYLGTLGPVSDHCDNNCCLVK